MTIQEAAAQLRHRKVSAVELTRQALAAIQRSNAKLNAFITVTEERALADARRADEELAAGADRGPLHGIPVALKDVFCTRGIRTTCGSALFRDYVPEIDSAVTERLAQAGSVLLGKTGMHELAYGITSNNPHFGPVRNPWNPSHVPGGSSGGSGCAVAAGLAFLAMGSDTGGSIRIPASFCGVVGLKPTTGRISRYGVMPLDYSLDHVGPMTRTVRDCALVMNILAGHDRRDDSSSKQPVKDYLPAREVSIRGLRLGLPSNWFFERCDPAAAAAVRTMARTAETLGAAVIAVTAPKMAELYAASRVVLLAEASACLEPYLERRAEIGADVMALLDQGRLVPATDYIQAQRLRRMIRDEFVQVFDRVDCLLTPTTPSGAPRLGQDTLRFGEIEEDVRLASTRYVRNINMLGLPALSLPCGFDAAGLPLGLQILGRPFAEDVVLRVGAALEDATHWTRTPPEAL